MAQQITVTEMMRSFSDIVSQVYYQDKSFDIKKGANIVARLVPSRQKRGIAIKDLEKLLANGPHLDKDDIDDFEEAMNEARALKPYCGDDDKWS